MRGLGLATWTSVALLARHVVADCMLEDFKDRFFVIFYLDKIEFNETMLDNFDNNYKKDGQIRTYYNITYAQLDDQGNAVGDPNSLDASPSSYEERDDPYVDDPQYRFHYSEIEIPGNLTLLAQAHHTNTNAPEEIIFVEIGALTVPVLDAEGYDLSVYGSRSSFGGNQTAPLLTNGESVGTVHYQLRLFATECYPGRHPTLEGYCVNATAGYIADGMSQTACPVGQYTDVDGQDTCRNCDTGFYQDSPAQTSCKQAQIGRYTNGIQEFVCAVGHFADSAGNTECTPCPPGMYQDEVASSECLPCAAGSYQEEYGRGSCDVCGECEDSYVRVNCTATSAGYCEDCNLLDQCPKESLSIGAIVGIVVGTVAFVIVIVGIVVYRHRKATQEEIKRKEEALQEMEREKQLIENMGTNVNPLLKENMKDTEELEAIHEAQQDKLEKMSDELRNMKKEKQLNASEDTVRVSIKSAKKKQFKAQNVVAYSSGMDK